MRFGYIWFYMDTKVNEIRLVKNALDISSFTQIQRISYVQWFLDNVLKPTRKRQKE